jgi:hypothetical protein
MAMVRRKTAAQASEGRLVRKWEALAYLASLGLGAGVAAYVTGLPVATESKAFT